MKKVTYIFILLLALSFKDGLEAQVFRPTAQQKEKKTFKAKPVETEERLLLITGCARSGTTYITKALTSCGLHLRHEDGLGEHGIVSWFLAVDSDWLPYRVHLNKCRFKHVFLQVRNPLKTIASASHEPMESWLYIQQFIPHISLTDPNIVKAAKYWYYWNLAAEKKAEWIYRVEDIDLVLEEMSARLGVPLNKEGLARVPRNANTRGYKEVYAWEDLRRALDPDLFLKITEMAKRYGYPVEQEQRGEPSPYTGLRH